ncbi:MAG: phosphatase PAP2 family protein [Proteobacteria bacterium]|jgi:membrane-associated phospholipid phosphatase|nr:phosphatase PAP2 family protein [Pseudomonadota bacterium]
MVNTSSLKQYVWTSLWITILWIILYRYTNHIAQFAAVKYDFSFAWEKNTPLIPWMILPYVSLNIMTFVPLFHLIPSEIRHLGRVMGLATVIAALVFYFFPAPLIHTRPDYVPTWNYFFQLVFSLDDVSNTLPSLHITYSTQLLLALWPKLKSFRYIYLPWFVLVCVSVLFTWQHHFMDIIAGVVLAVSLQLIVPKLLRDESFRWGI